MSLIITRKVKEVVRVNVNGKIFKIFVLGIKGKQVRLGFDADEEVMIDRDEMLEVET